MPYTLVAGDNFHPHEKDDECEVGKFATAAEVVAAARAFLRKSVAGHYSKGMSAEDLFKQFSGFGEITYIFADSGDPPVRMDRWAYDREVAEEIAAGG